MINCANSNKRNSYISLNLFAKTSYYYYKKKTHKIQNTLKNMKPSFTACDEKAMSVAVHANTLFLQQPPLFFGSH